MLHNYLSHGELKSNDKKNSSTEKWKKRKPSGMWLRALGLSKWEKKQRGGDAKKLCLMVPSKMAWAVGSVFWVVGEGEGGSGTPASSCWRSPLPRYLPRRLWRPCGLPLRLRSLPCRPPGQSSFASLLVLRPEGRTLPSCPRSGGAHHSLAGVAVALVAGCPSQVQAPRNWLAGVLKPRNCPQRSLHLN